MNHTRPPHPNPLPPGEREAEATCMNLTRQLIQAHLVSGDMTPGAEISLRIDQTLSQDATGTLSYLQFEAIGVPRVQTQLSVSYVDHNMLQGDFRNADDHVYLQDVAAKYGLHYSRPGNGICHQVHLERYAVPGTTLLGTDSHTPTCGGMGVLAIGAGGLDVALAMSGSAYNMRMPKVLGVELHGRLQPGVTAKDVIFEVLRRLTVKGGVGRVLEYYGPGAAHLDVPERATITNMGAELGATTSIFPSDERTAAYLERQQRLDAFTPLAAADGATYDEHMRIDLDTLEPLIRAAVQPGQHLFDQRGAGHSGQPGGGRQLHQFLVQRPDDHRRHAQGPYGAPAGEPGGQSGVAASAADDRPQRRPGGPYRRRGAHSGIRLRAVRRHGAGAVVRRRVGALVQPQFPRTVRRPQQPRVLGQPGGLCGGSPGR